MSVDATMPTMPSVPTPAAIAQIQAFFAELSSATSPASSGASGVSDAFSTILDAASQSGSTSGSTSAASSTSSSASGATAASELAQLGASSASGVGTALASTGASAGSSSPVVTDAERYLGVPYQWGGTSPTTGFDCSGLVQHVFGDLGVSIPRTSEQQAQVGAPVASLADAQPGDLLFFEPGQNGAPPGEPGHVAIYVGNGDMIAAPETGEVVQIQKVPSTPIAIRRITVPETATASGASTPVASSTAGASTTGSGTAPTALGAPATAGASGSAAAGASVEMGQVAVPAAYAGLVTSAANASGVPANLLAALLQTESGFDPNAVSSAGAQGIAQFMPATSASRNVNAFDPTEAIPAAAQMLSGLHASLGSWSLAVAGYNAGPGAVEAAGGVPNIPQTQDEVKTVLSLADMSPTS